MTYRLEFTYPGLTRMHNASGKTRDFRTVNREAQLVKNTVAWLVYKNRPPTPLKYASLTLVRASAVCPDHDGNVAGFKFIIDGLVLGGVLENDKPDNIGFPKYRWKSVPQNQGFLWIRIDELPDSPKGEMVYTDAIEVTQNEVGKTRKTKELIK